jgi:hypothetical protein
MSQQQIDALSTVLAELPKEAYDKIYDYIMYLKYRIDIKNDIEIKEEEELYNKLEEARIDIENGNGIPAEQAFSEIEKKYFSNN